MRHIKTQVWLLAFAMTIGLSVTACDSKTAQDDKEKTAKPAKQKEDAEKDKDIYFYTSTDRKEKKVVEVEKLGFTNQIATIAPKEFEGNTHIKEMWVGPKVPHIAEDAFSGCTSLQTADFGDQIWWIREGAFKGCTALKRIILTITMKKLDDGAFEGCTGLEEVTIPNDVKNRMFGMLEAPEKLR